MKEQRRPASSPASYAASWSASWAPGAYQAQSGFKNAYSVSCDGTDDYISLGPSNDIITSNVFSISMWFKIGDTASGAKRIFVSNRDGGATNLRFVVETNGTLNVGYKNSGGSFQFTLSPSAVDDNNWHHVVFTTTASAQVLYIDGSAVTTTTNGFENGASSTVVTTIGAHVSSAIYANMKADEVATFAGTVLSASDVTDIYNSGVPSDISSLNPTGWWRMGENDGGTGTNVTDQGSGGHDGSLVNGAEFSSDVP